MEPQNHQRSRRPDPRGRNLWEEECEIRKKAELAASQRQDNKSGGGGKGRFMRVLVALGLGALVFVMIGYFDMNLLWNEDANADIVDSTVKEIDNNNNNGNINNNDTGGPNDTSNLRSPSPPPPVAPEPTQPPPVVAPPTPTTATAIGTEPATTKANNDDDNNNKSCADICRSNTNTKPQGLFDHGKDVLDRKQLLEIAEMEKQKLLTKLYKDYGKDNFENMYLNKETGKYHGIKELVESGFSFDTLKRKFLIKLLSVQAQIVDDDDQTTTASSNNGGAGGDVDGCDCNSISSSNQKKHHRTLMKHNPNNNNEPDPIVGKIYEKYVWATGGHSSAAGHGNMFNESYTAYMDRDMTPFLAAFGIEFDGRNYAMGGTSSGLEISSCWEQVYGTDVDIFSWDFGMTDGKAAIRGMHFAHRGALSRGHPVFVTINFKWGREHLFRLEDVGIAQFTWDEHAASLMSKAIPDSAGKTDEEISKMPDYVRNYKCTGAEQDMMERGDPYCSDERYTSYYCPDRSKKAWWHPGFKHHAKVGHALSLFLVQTFMDALKDLSEHDVKDPKVLLAQLKEEDDKAYKNIVDSPLVKQEDSHGHMSFVGVDNTTWNEENIEVAEMLFKGPSICRTARLPAQSRYLGYTTNTAKTGGIAALGNETYDTGIEWADARETAKGSNEEMRLVWIQDGKNDERNRECMDQILKPDYKDMFLARSSEGWVKLTFPNKAEKDAYGYDSSKFHGFLAINLVNCDWGKCVKTDIRINGGEKNFRGNPIDEGWLEMTVNGKEVKSFFIFQGGLAALVGEQGIGKWEPNSNGEYEIAVRVNEKGSYFRISSVILY